MGLTNFPNGITSFGIPQIGTGIPVTGGNYFFVDSGSTGSATGANVGTWDNPYTTLGAAYTAATSANEDVIICKAGHAETISAATGLVMAKVGITVVGLGKGTSRPTFTLSGTAATCTMNVTGADQTFHNLLFTAGVDELVTVFTIAAAYCTLDAVDYYESSASFQCLSFVTTTAAGDYLTVKNCTARQTTAAAGNATCIELVGADDATIENNRIFWIGANNAATCAIASVGTVALRALIVNNYCHVTGGANVIPISMLASSTGLAAYNKVASTKTAVLGSIALANLYGIENYATETVNTNGILDPIVT
jgi:hypothetical protein